MIGLALLGAAVHLATGSAREFRGGLLTAVAVAAVLVIAPVALDQRGPVATALAWRPLAWLGGISYGIYLWHWPIFLVLNGQRTGWQGCRCSPLRCAATLAISVVSWWAIEQPVRKWRPVRVPLLPLAGATAATAAAVTLLVVPVVPKPGVSALDASLPPGCVAGRGRLAVACRRESGPRGRSRSETRDARSPSRCSATRSAGR